jgi:hypothetical protein
MNGLAKLIKAGRVNLSRRVESNKPGVLCAVAAVLLLLGWRGLVWANRPAHVLDIARELGSIGQFKDDLYPNKSGTRLVYTQDTMSGAGLFFCNVATGKAKLLCELKESEFDWRRFGMLGWSPDDSKFAYALPATKDKIFICVGNAESGEIMAKVEAPGNLAELAWLTTNSFAYLLAYYQVLAVVAQQPDGQWAESRNFGLVYQGEGSARNLVATSPNSVAWSNGTNIWALDFHAATPKIIWHGTTNQLLAITYSREENELLLNCTDETGQYLIRFDPAKNWVASAGRVGDLRQTIPHITWFNGPRYACRRNDGGTNTFFIKRGVNTPPARLSWPGAVRTFALSGDHLYVAGSVGGEPAGIYDYDASSGELRFVISSVKSPLHYAKSVSPIDGVLTNEQGRLISYHLWRPAAIALQKKYPLIIGQTPYIWMPFPQIAASQGYCFVFIERPDWFGGLENWSDDVMAVHHRLAEDPNVDTDRVFLYGASAETAYIGQLLEEKPDLWRGVITFSPSGLPNLSTTRVSSMLIVVGKEEGEAVTQRWLKYQDDAASIGIRINLVFQNGAQHISRSITTELERAENLAKFLNEN